MAAVPRCVGAKCRQKPGVKARKLVWGKMGSFTTYARCLERGLSQKPPNPGNGKEKWWRRYVLLSEDYVQNQTDVLVPESNRTNTTQRRQKRPDTEIECASANKWCFCTSAKHVAASGGFTPAITGCRAGRMSLNVVRLRTLPLALRL